MKSIKSSPKDRFVQEMDRLVETLNAIDNDTPWQHVEPEWWLKLSEIRRLAADASLKFKTSVSPVHNDCQ